MAGLSLQKGVIVELNGRRYTCGKRGPGGAYIFAPDKGRSNLSLKPEAAWDALQRDHLKIVQESTDSDDISLPENYFETSTLSKEEQDNLLMRHFYMQEVHQYRNEGGKLSNAALDDFVRRTHSKYVTECRKKGRPKPKSAMSAATVRRWYKKWTNTGFNIISLVHDKRGNSHSKLTIEQEDILFAAIHDDYMNTQRITAQQAHDLMVARINVENRARKVRGEKEIKAPHYNTLLKHLSRIDLYDKLKARFNASYALKVTREYGITPPTKRHLERVQVDHTLLDIYVDFGKKSLVRPWLTLVIDSFSGAIMGYWITPNPASSESVMQALRMAVMPKDMHALGGEPNWYWPMQGIPSELTLDNGKEFHGKDLELAAAALGITLNFTPPRQPWFKAQVERMFGQINRSLLSQLPGQVFKYEPEKHGMNYPHITIDEFKHIFLQWVTTIRHRKPYKDGYTPNERWTESVQKHGMPGSGLPSEYIDLCLSKSAGKRTLYSNGINHLNLTFNNDWLSRLRNELAPRGSGRNPKVTVKWSARDVGKIWVLHPDNHQFFPVLSKEEYAHGRSLYNHKIILREQRNRRKARMQDADYTDATLALDSAIKTLTKGKLAKGKKMGTKFARFMEGQPSSPTSHTEAPTQPKSPNSNAPLTNPLDDGIVTFEDMEI